MITRLIYCGNYKRANRLVWGSFIHMILIEFHLENDEESNGVGTVGVKSTELVLWLQKSWIDSVPWDGEVFIFF